MHQSATPTNRKFGLTFGAAFLAAAVVAMWRHRTGSATAFIAASVLFTGLAIAAPTVLGPLNRAWMGLARLLNRFVSPIVLGVMFFGIITPMAAIMRAAGRDPLRLRRTSATTFWVARDQPGPEPGSLNRQF